MTWLALALALAAAPPAAPPGGALGALADGVAAQVGQPEEGRRSLALALSAEPAALGPPLSAALAAALGRSGWAVSPVPPGPGAEAAARADGADWLVSLTAGGGPEGREVAAVGEAVALWSSFFLQARPGVRAAPPRLVSARAPADAAALLLLRGAGPAALRPALTRLATLHGEVVALATGQVEGLGPALLAVLAERGGGLDVTLLDTTGRPVASWRPDPSALQPVRRPAAVAVVAPLGGGALGVALAGGAGGEVLARRGARLERVATLAMAPLAAGATGVLFGAFAPGRAALQDLLTLGVDPGARPRSAGDLVAVAAAPRGGVPAFGALHAGGRLELLDERLAPVGEVPGVGAGFALADLDGDGSAEVVASEPVVGGADRLRVVRATPTAATLWTSPPIEGAILAAAAWDRTGRGPDEVVLAVVREGAFGEPVATELWLLSTGEVPSP